MGSIYQGIGGAVGIGEESTWGTAVARSVWRPLITGSLARQITYTPRPNLQDSTGAPFKKNHFKESDNVAGSLELEATYENLGVIFYHLLGAKASTGSGPYTHTYTTAAALPTGLTLEFIRSGANFGDLSEVFEGCKINEATFSISAGGVMTVSLDIIGETSAARGNGGTPTFNTATPVLHHQASTLTWNSGTYNLTDMSITYNNALTRRLLLGSANTAQPLRNDFCSCTMSVTLEVNDQFVVDYKADTEANDLAITFTGTGNNSLEFDVYQAYITNVSDPVSGPGIVTQTVDFEAQFTGINEGLRIVNINDNADYITGA